MTIREASHAGSWYTDHGPTLSEELEDWLAQVHPSINCEGPIPQPGARVIIAPYVFIGAAVNALDQPTNRGP